MKSLIDKQDCNRDNARFLWLPGLICLSNRFTNCETATDFYRLLWDFMCYGKIS